MSQSPKRILLLDDDYESMAPLKIFLEAVHSFEVTLTAAATLPEQLAKERFDLICLDLMIHPVSLDANNQEITNLHFSGVNWQKTGLTFLERLRAGAFVDVSASTDSPPWRNGQGATSFHVDSGQPAEDQVGTSPSVPVIILSAVADLSRQESLLQNDEQTLYLEKPFDLEEFIELVGQLI